MHHFVSLADQGFLPQIVALYWSLVRHSKSFRLWILCLDEIIYNCLKDIDLDYIRVLSLDACETDALRTVKPSRSKAEYCWTLTPFTFGFVFEKEPNAECVTYIDADISFFDDPEILMKEFRESGKDVMITPHWYSPKYDKSKKSGIFCVQYLSVRNTSGAELVIRWWQEKCLEWCYERPSKGRLGDQKYLDQWPVLFNDNVHISNQEGRLLAPWNVNYYINKGNGHIKPILFHYHGLRMITKRYLLAYIGYDASLGYSELYVPYITELKKALAILKDGGFSVDANRSSSSLRNIFLMIKRLVVLGDSCYIDLERMGKVNSWILVKQRIFGEC